jgi:hypothetical protein
MARRQCAFGKRPDLPMCGLSLFAKVAARSGKSAVCRRAGGTAAGQHNRQRGGNETIKTGGVGGHKVRVQRRVGSPSCARNNVRAVEM